MTTMEVPLGTVNVIWNVVLHWPPPCGSFSETYVNPVRSAPVPKILIDPGICGGGVPADPPQFTRVAEGIAKVSAGEAGVHCPDGSLSAHGLLWFAWFAFDVVLVVSVASNEPR